MSANTDVPLYEVCTQVGNLQESTFLEITQFHVIGTRLVSLLIIEKIEGGHRLSVTEAFIEKYGRHQDLVSINFLENPHVETKSEVFSLRRLHQCRIDDKAMFLEIRDSSDRVTVLNGLVPGEKLVRMSVVRKNMECAP